MPATGRAHAGVHSQDLYATESISAIIVLRVAISASERIAAVVDVVRVELLPRVAFGEGFCSLKRHWISQKMSGADE